MPTEKQKANKTQSVASSPKDKKSSSLQPIERSGLNMKAIIIGCVVIIIVSIGLCGLGSLGSSLTGDSDNKNETTAKTSEETNNNTPEASTIETTTKEEIAKIDDIKISGSGDSATNFVDLEKGLSLFQMSHNGSANFIVQLINKETGGTIELLVNEIGKYEGTTYANIESKGQYLLEVQADGTWSGTIQQPRQEAKQGVPYEETGNGDTVFPIKLNDGLLVLEMTHDGLANFVVSIINSDGSFSDLVANEIGSYDGSKSVSVYGGGTYYVAIQADGAWTIKMN